MKNKFKLLIASVSIAMLFLSSCEKEMYDDAIYKSQQPQNLSISKISFKELKSNKNAVEKIKRVMTKKLPTSIANRAVYNEDFGVLIDTTNIVQMTSATEQSITFNIVDYTDSTKKENLVLVSKNDGNFEAYIAEYNLTQQDLDILASGGTLQNIQPTSISEIESMSKIAVSSSCMSTSSSTEYICNPSNGGESYSFGFSYSGGCNGTMTYLIHNIVSIDYSCISQGGGSLYTGSGISSESSGSGSNSSSGSGYSGGSGYNGSFSGNYINTTFVPCTSCLELSEELNDFLSDLSDTQLEWWNSLDNRTKESIVNYLNDNDYSADSIQLIEDLQIACDEYLTLYGNNSSTQFFIKNVIKNILNPQTDITPEEEVVLPPDCESFNFVNTYSNWQEAALTNVHFQVNVISPSGIYVNHIVEFPQPILFGVPRHFAVGGATISPGLAAWLSAKALRISMNDTVKMYGNKPVTSTIVNLYFEQRLRHNYPIVTNGGRVNIHPTTISVTPTPYQTNAFGIGDCE